MTELDVCGLPPPEPFEQILLSLQMLPDGETLCVRIHREPFPLYEVLREMGYSWQTRELTDGNFEILIQR